MIDRGNQPEPTVGMLLEAFSSRFAIGFLAATVSHGFHPIVAGALVSLLIGLSDAFGLRAYMGILGTGLLFDAVPGWITSAWVLRERFEPSQTRHISEDEPYLLDHGYGSAEVVA